MDVHITMPEGAVNMQTFNQNVGERYIFESDGGMVRTKR